VKSGPALLAFALALAALAAQARADEAGGPEGVIFAVACFEKAETASAARLRSGRIDAGDLGELRSLKTLAHLVALRGPGAPAELKPGEKALAFIRRVRDRAALTFPDAAAVIDDGLGALAEPTNFILQPQLIPARAEPAAVALVSEDDRCALTAIGRIKEEHRKRAVSIDRRLYRHPLMSELDRALVLLQFILQPQYLSPETASWDTDQAIAALIRAEGGTVSGLVSAFYRRDSFGELDPHDGLVFPAALAQVAAVRFGEIAHRVWMEGRREGIPAGRIGHRVRETLGNFYNHGPIHYPGALIDPVGRSLAEVIPLLAIFVDDGSVQRLQRLLEDLIDEIATIAADAHPRLRFDEYEDRPRFRPLIGKEVEAFFPDYRLPQL
jgi:hypothetical protein